MILSSNNTLSSGNADTEHLFMCLLARCIYSLEKCLLISFAQIVQKSILLITGECKSNYNEVLPPHPPGFTDGSVVKNLPANAEDTGSIPGPGVRATKPMLHNYWACALEPRSHNY